MTASVGLSTLISTMSLGLTAVVVSRALGPHGRGVFTACLSLVYVLVMLGTAGVGLAGRRLLASKPPDRVFLREFNAVRRGLLAAQAGAAALAAAFLLPLFGAGESIEQKVGFVACSTFTLGALLSREALFGVGAGRLAAKLMAAASCAILISTALLVLTGRSTATNFLWVYAFAALAEFVVASCSAARIGPDDHPTVRPGAPSRILRSGRPVILLLFAQALASRGDRLVVGLRLDPSELGYYAVAVTVMEILTLGAVALGQSAFQGLAGETLAASSMSKARRQLLAATTILSVLVAVASPWVVQLVFGTEFNDAAPVLRILALAAVPCASYQVDLQHLVATNRAGAAAAIAAVGAVALVLGNLAVLGVFGVVGAAGVVLGVYIAVSAAARLAVRAGA